MDAKSVPLLSADYDQFIMTVPMICARRLSDVTVKYKRGGT